MMELPAAEDETEMALDARTVRLSVDLSPLAYRRLCAEQMRRRLSGERVSLRALILAALDAYLAEAS